jgi:hypothetical protein
MPPSLRAFVPKTAKQHSLGQIQPPYCLQKAFVLGRWPHPPSANSIPTNAVQAAKGAGRAASRPWASTGSTTRPTPRRDDACAGCCVLIPLLFPSCRHIRKPIGIVLGLQESEGHSFMVDGCTEPAQIDSLQLRVSTATPTRRCLFSPCPCFQVVGTILKPIGAPPSLFFATSSVIQSSSADGGTLGAMLSACRGVTCSQHPTLEPPRPCASAAVSPSMARPSPAGRSAHCLQHSHA